MKATYGMQFDEADFGIRVTKQVGEGWISSRARTNHLGYVESDKKAPLRGLGIERPKRAYTFGRNRMKFARHHFRWYQAVVVMLAFAPMTACYYLLLAIRHGRHFADLRMPAERLLESAVSTAQSGSGDEVVPLRECLCAGEFPVL